MSGHSKWSSIKHKKAAVDAKRGQQFTKLARAITVAAREGGGDPDANPSLATAIQKARDASMPKDNIQRAVDRGTGAGADADAIVRIVFEGYGPGGTAVLVEALTDNRNRTSADVRHAFTRHGGSLGEPGSVAWIFEKRGAVVVDGTRYGEDDLIAAIDAGAEDVQEDGDLLRVLSEPSDLTRRARGAGGCRGRDPVRRAGDGAEEHGRGREVRRRASCCASSTTSPSTTTSTKSTPTSTSPRRSSNRGLEGIRGSAQNHFPCKS